MNYVTKTLNSLRISLVLSGDLKGKLGDAKGKLGDVSNDALLKDDYGII